MYSNSSSSVCAFSYFGVFSFIAMYNKSSKLLAIKTMVLNGSFGIAREWCTRRPSNQFS